MELAGVVIHNNIARASAITALTESICGGGWFCTGFPMIMSFSERDEASKPPNTDSKTMIARRRDVSEIRALCISIFLRALSLGRITEILDRGFDHHDMECVIFLGRSLHLRFGLISRFRYTPSNLDLYPAPRASAASSASFLRLITSVLESNAQISSKVSLNER